MGEEEEEKMSKITKRELLIERMKMEIEKKVNGKYLLVGDGTSQDFWEFMRFLSYDGKKHWWEFWK